MLISWHVSGQPQWPYVTRPPLRADALGIQTLAECLGTSLASKPSSFLSTLLRSLKFSAAHIALNVVITMFHSTMWPELENSIAGCHAIVDILPYLTIWNSRLMEMFEWSRCYKHYFVLESIFRFPQIVKIWRPVYWLYLIFASFDLCASLIASWACRSLAPLKYWITRRGRQVPVHRPPIVSHRQLLLHTVHCNAMFGSINWRLIGN